MQFKVGELKSVCIAMPIIMCPIYRGSKSPTFSIPFHHYYLPRGWAVMGLQPPFLLEGGRGYSNPLTFKAGPPQPIIPLCPVPMVPLLSSMTPLSESWDSAVGGGGGYSQGSGYSHL